MSSTKFRVVLGSIFLLAAPVALFLFFYLKFNPVSSLFSASSFQILAIVAVLSLIGVFFMYIAGIIIPNLFAPVSDSEPLDYSAWAIFGGVVLAMFVTLLLHSQWQIADNASDPRNEDIELRSILLYLDPEDVVHDHTYCSDSFLVDEYSAISIKNLIYNETFLEYEICERCNWAFYDRQSDMIHYFVECINIPNSHREDIERIDSIFEYAEYSLENMCPYCY